MSKKFIFFVILFLSTSFKPMGESETFIQVEPIRVDKIDQKLTELEYQKNKVELQIQTIRELEKELNDATLR